MIFNYWNPKTDLIVDKRFFQILELACVNSKRKAKPQTFIYLFSVYTKKNHWLKAKPSSTFLKD